MPLAKLRVLLTAVGCPGGVSMIHALKNNGERELEIVGTDLRENAAGRFFVDSFHTVPAGSSPDFIPRLLDIVHQERPDVLLPQSSYEILALAHHRDEFERLGVPVVVGSADSVERGSDKWLTYLALEGSDVPRPRSIRCSNVEAFKRAVHELGYPEQRVCFKPPWSKGTRGFRILTDEANRLHLLLYERPDAMLMTLPEALDILADADPVPELLVMDYAEGMEHTVDIFCRRGEVLMGFVKTREAVKAGLAMYFEIVHRPDLMHYGQVIAHRLDLDYFANIQFKGDMLLEVNPRVSTFVHQPDFNMPYLGLKYVLGEVDENDLRQAQERIRTTRRSVRYYDQVSYDID